MRIWIASVLLGLAALPSSVCAQYPAYYPPPGYYYPQPVYAPQYQQYPAAPMYQNPNPYPMPPYYQGMTPYQAVPQYQSPMPYNGAIFQAPQSKMGPMLPINASAVVRTQATDPPAKKTVAPLESPAKVPLPLLETPATKPIAPVENPAKASTPPLDTPSKLLALPSVEAPTKTVGTVTLENTSEKTSDTSSIALPAPNAGTLPVIPSPAAAPKDDAARKPIYSALFPTGGKEAIPAPVMNPITPTAPLCLVDACETNRHRFVVFGDYLFWTVHGVDVPYAQAFDGILPGLSAPRGAVSVVSPNFSSGFRVGGGALFHDGNSGIYATFTYFRTNRSSDAAAPDPFVLHNFLAFPNTLNSAVDSLTAHVDYRIQLYMADLDYKCAIVNNNHLVLNWLTGIKYAHLQQNLDATFQITGTTTVNSDINFDGIGPRIGLDGRYCVAGGFYGYAQGIFDLLFGQFRANSIEQNVFTGLVGQTGITANRVVPILEMELGVGWQSPSGAFRLQGGYYVGAWFNTITMTSLSQGITATNFTTNSNNFRDNMTFDGLVLRAEIRY
jgi:hypothetical protein